MNYKSKILSPLDLQLDEYNPRFILPQGSSQSDILSYLLENEEVLDLAKGINSNRGLLIGERIIVCKENNKYVVVEGNRRASACKILLDNSLLPLAYKKKLVNINKETLSNISQIPVDVANSRLEAQSAIGTKHISGVKKWNPYAKIKFFAAQFDSGRSLEYISDITSIPKPRVTSDIKSYKIIQYAYNLPIWSDDEKKILFDFENFDISIFTKALTLKSDVLGSYMNALLKLKYNAKTLNPETDLPKDVFDHCIYLIAKYSFNKDLKFNTRSSIDSITELISFLDDYYSKSSLDKNKKATPIVDLEPDDDLEPDSNKDINDELQQISMFGNGDSIVPTDKNKDVPLDNPDDNDTINPPESKRPQPPTKSQRPISNEFFGDLTWSKVDANSPHNRGLLDICNEIVEISKNKAFKKYTISATILMRALLEQTLIYHLRKINKYDTLCKGNNGKTPQLEKIIDYYNKNLDNIFQGNLNIKRSFSGFAKSSGNKDYFDMVIHNPHLVGANCDNLVLIATVGLRGFINQILELD